MDGWEARAGDEIAVESHRLRGPRRTGTIVEILGEAPHERYRVRWDDGRESVFHPGPDAVLRPRSRRPDGRPRRVRREPAPTRLPERPEPKAPPEPRRRRPRAAPGDRLVIRGHHLGDRQRDGKILEVLGADGGPPFRIRWSDTGREGILYPGPDALVEHYAKKPRKARPQQAGRHGRP